MNNRIINQYKRILQHAPDAVLDELIWNVDCSRANRSMWFAACDVQSKRDDGTRKGFCPECGQHKAFHSYLPATDNEPGEFSCDLSPDVPHFVARDQGRMSDTMYYDLLESQIPF
jgi:hypothetical protein